MRYSSILLAALVACTVTAQDTATTMAMKTKAVKSHTASSGADAPATSAMAAGGTTGSATGKANKSKSAKTSGGNSTAAAMSTPGSIPTGTGAAYGMSAMGSTSATIEVTSAIGSETTSSTPAVQTKNAGERVLLSSGNAMVIVGLGFVFAVYM
jgi:hypothetical protein